MKLINKKYFIVSLALTVSFLAVGCNQSKETSMGEKSANSGENVKIVENQKPITQTEENENKESNEKNKKKNDENTSNENNKDSNDEKEYSVTLTYPSTDYVVDGNEENRYVKTNTSMTSTEKEVVTKVLNKLKDAPSLEGAEPVGLGKFKVKDSYLDNGKAVVDFSSSSLNGSNLEEEIVVSSIVDSLLSVDGVKSVEFLVDGKPADSLMGHMDVSSSFTNFIAK